MTNVGADDSSLDLNLKLSVHGDGFQASPQASPEGGPEGGGSGWLRGIFVPLVTPFDRDGTRVDAAALERLGHEVLDDGAAGIVALGTTAEAGALDAAERREVADVCARVCADRGVPLVVGIGANDTRKAAQELAALTDAASGPALGAAPDAALGVAPTAALVTVPSFTRPSEAGVVAHFAALAAHSPVPLVIYHIPYRTGRALSAETLRELALLLGVAGVKHAVGGVDADTVALLGDPAAVGGGGFAVMAGDDLYVSPMLALGASGGVLASAHLATAAFAALADRWERGDAAGARALGHRLARLSAALFAEPNPVVLKGVLAAQGRIPHATVRLPLLPAAPENVTAALRALDDVDRGLGEAEAAA
ncbi:dihydrodipicolinate synthase family protein [Streptodolium elevatio]|uniref:Dihydrodipicolinate synthase family protein n=1 Tax=Streptodolium elevatio TaxID=3157996 RepID=A0ABV3DPU0_9ACTN